MTTADTADDTTGLLRPHAEQRYAEELAALAAGQGRERAAELIGGVKPW